jgi:hypothetical protein
MKKLVLITSIVMANLLIAIESKGQNSVYIISELHRSYSGSTNPDWDSVYVTAPTGTVTGYQIPWRNNVAGRDAALSVIINGITSLGYTISDYTISYPSDANLGSPTGNVSSAVYRWFLKKP